MSGTNRPNMGIQVGVNQDRAVTCRPMPASFRATTTDINVDANSPPNVRDLVQAAVDAIEAHFDDRDAIEEIILLISQRLRGQNISENNTHHWSDALERFVDILYAVTEVQLQDGPTRTVLEYLECKIEAILKECIKCFLNLQGYQEKRKLILGLFAGNYIERLTKKYFDKEFRLRVMTIPVDIAKGDGTRLDEKERATVSLFLKKMLAEVSITVWMNLHQLLPLLDEDRESVEQSSIKITIDLTGNYDKRSGTHRLLPSPEIVKRELTEAISNMTDQDQTIRKAFEHLIDPAHLRCTDLLERSNVPIGDQGSTQPDGNEYINKTYAPTEQNLVMIGNGQTAVIIEDRTTDRQDVTTEEIVQLIVKVLLNKYDEGSSELGTRTKIQGEKTAKSQTESSPIISTEIISKLQERNIEVEKQRLKLEEQLEEQWLKTEEQNRKVEEQWIKQEEEKLKLEEQARKLEEERLKQEEQARKLVEEKLKQEEQARKLEEEKLKQEEVRLTADERFRKLEERILKLEEWLRILDIKRSGAAAATAGTAADITTSITTTINTPAAPPNTETFDDADDKEHAHSG